MLEDNNLNLIRNKKLSIERFGTDFHIGSKNNIAYKCPFCVSRRGKADSDYKMYVSLENSAFYCFKCHAKGYLNRKNIKLSSYGVYEEITEFFRSSKEYNGDEGDDSENIFYLPPIEIADNSVAYEYCISRGISRDIINYYDIRLGVDDLFGRIVIPNITYGNKRQWTDIYSARSFLNQEPKYRMPSDSEKNKIVFNIHRIDDNCENIFINEGVITSIMAGKSSVAIFGCHPSDYQINKIVGKNSKNYYCTLDNDEAGRPQNEKLADTLSRVTNSSSNVYLVYMPRNKDAADLGEKLYIEYVMDNRVLYNDSTYGKIYSYFS